MTIIYDGECKVNNINELPVGAVFILEEKESKSDHPAVFIKDDDIVVSLRGTCYTSGQLSKHIEEIVRVAIHPIILPGHRYTEIQYRLIEDIELGEMFIYDSQLYMKCRYIDNTACAYNISNMELCLNMPMDDRVIWAPFIGMHIVNE